MNKKIIISAASAVVTLGLAIFTGLKVNEDYLKKADIPENVTELIAGCNENDASKVKGCFFFDDDEEKSKAFKDCDSIDDIIDFAGTKTGLCFAYMDEVEEQEADEASSQAAAELDALLGIEQDGEDEPAAQPAKKAKRLYTTKSLTVIASYSVKKSEMSEYTVGYPEGTKVYPVVIEAAYTDKDGAEKTEVRLFRFYTNKKGKIVGIGF